MYDLQRTQRRIEATTNYFRFVDSGHPDLTTLFMDDAVMYFPKFGMAYGKAEIGIFAQGFGDELVEIEHNIEGFNVLPSGECVVVEGQVKGATRTGGVWHDGIYSQGRFCNVFEFAVDLIKRLHIYEDPDFNSADTPRVLWANKVHEALRKHRLGK